MCRYRRNLPTKATALGPSPHVCPRDWELPPLASFRRPGAARGNQKMEPPAPSVQTRCPGPPLLFHVPSPADPIIQAHRAREWGNHRQRRAWVDPARGIQKSPRKPRPTFLNKKRLVDFISVEFQYFIQCAS
jgi:hypothetical protein